MLAAYLPYISLISPLCLQAMLAAYLPYTSLIFPLCLQAMLAATRGDGARARREAMRLTAEAATRETQHAAALAAAQQEA